MSFKRSLEDLIQYCERNNFQGWDPFDGLNSKFFRKTPLNNWSLARLLWIQFFKRNPVNLRRLFLISKGFNPKGLALFLTGYCKLYRIQPDENRLDTIQFLADKIIKLKSEGYSGTCWGYNFDWQARGQLYFPAGTPNIVTTTFCASALIDAFEITQNQEYLESAISTGDFVVNDLNRTEKKRGLIFSYSPLKGNDNVYNASLMASKLLSLCFYFTRKEEYAYLAHESVLACTEVQNEDGSWVYGELPFQNWIDSFHTGYNLNCIQSYQKNCHDYRYKNKIEKGFNYYINNFFLEEGTPKYYNDRIYPIDIHSPAQLFVTLAELGYFTKFHDLAAKVMSWTIENMQDKKGYYYYQIHKRYKNKIPYIRWSQAFMFYGMCYFYFELMKSKNSLLK